MGILNASIVRLGVVVGLAAEARIARPLGPTAAGGGTSAGAGAAAERLVAEGARALLSFGLCGGLDPALPPGALVVPAEVLECAGPVRDLRAALRSGNGSTDRYATDACLSAAIAGDADSHGAILSPRAVIATIAEKSAVHDMTGAIAVDLESGAVARVAARHGLAFAVLRAVCDPADLALPPAALAALDRDGAIGLLRVMRSIAARPDQVPALLALAFDAASARRALVGRVRDLVRGGGFLVP